MTETATTSRAQRFRERIPTLLVWYCRIVALASILSALSPRTNERIDRLPDYILFSLGFLLGVPSIGFGVLMLMLGAAVRRRKRVAWWLLMVLGLFVGPLGWLAISALLYDVSSSDLQPLAPLIVAFVVQALFIAVVIWSRKLFYAVFDAANFRRALVVLAVSLALSTILGVTLVAQNDANPSTDLGDQALYTLKAGMAGTGIWWYDTAVEVPHWVDVTVNLIGSVMILAVAWALFQPRRGTVRHQADDDARLRALMDKFGDQDSLGYFNLRQDKAVMWSPTGKAAVAYRPVGGVSLASGDPIGDVEAWPGAIEAWLAEARQHGWVPAVMGASEEGGKVLSRFGLDAIELGDEAVVEVDDFTLEGRAMRVVRQAYNRVERAGYTTRIRRHADIPAEEMAWLVRKADDWRDGAVERGFSMALGRLGDPADGQCVMVECLDGAGTLRALLSFVPWGTKGLSLDLMRRERGTENGLVEFMVIDLIKAGPEHKVERVSLNFAMFRSIFDRAGRIGAGPFLRLARVVLTLFSRWWQLESLYRANMKYRPVWEPRYVCFPKARDLARIAIAAGRAEGFIALPTPRFLHLRRKPELAAAPPPEQPGED
ncbi:phosphatidylglycerol lysyltransferase domain-containing protein [Catenulispora pinisilvae]|uniref:phosphatidylglycerol lysyltransferase domain-containing protein n=1 Tax=Catenulispora pinisilvae TaxID=2705253 RepID=UPI0018915F27|nr:phosphatidylglycerol lysyltransferase domain-containing protein [Catenulispora pinisilvae]